MCGHQAMGMYSQREVGVEAPDPLQFHDPGSSTRDSRCGLVGERWDHPMVVFRRVGDSLSPFPAPAPVTSSSAGFSSPYPLSPTGRGGAATPLPSFGLFTTTLGGLINSFLLFF